jgi:type II secretion system protein I
VREAFTLLEIIVALAIFVGALAIVSKLVELGTRHALYAQLHTRAIVLAQSKMAELEAGIVPLQASTAEVFEDDPAWQWQIEITTGPFNGLKHVILTVWPTPGGEVGQTREPVQFQLQRWLFDPAYRTELDDAAAAAAASTSTSSSATSGTGGTP